MTGAFTRLRRCQICHTFAFYRRTRDDNSGSVERSSYLDRVRAARFPSSERSSPATGSVPSRYPGEAAPNLRERGGGGRRGKNPEMNNPRRKNDRKTSEAIQRSGRGVSIPPDPLTVSVQFDCRDRRCASALPLRPSAALRGAEPSRGKTRPDRGSLAATPSKRHRRTVSASSTAGRRHLGGGRSGGGSGRRGEKLQNYLKRKEN